MSRKEATSPLDNDLTGEVLDILDRERIALFEETYGLTTQKSLSVEKGFELLGTSAESNRKNLPNKRAQRFLNAAIDHCEELFLLSAIAGGAAGLISTFAKIKTELSISKVLHWWDTVSHPPKLTYFRKDFSFKFNNPPTIVQPPNKRARTLPRNTLKAGELAYRENKTLQWKSPVETSQTGENSCLAASEPLEEYRTILKRLYPTHDTKSLLLLSRQQLIALLDFSGPQGSPSRTSPVEFGTSPDFQDWGASSSQVEYSRTDPQHYDPRNAIPTPSLQQLGVSQNPSAAASTFQSFEPAHQIDKWRLSNSRVEHNRTSLPINSIIDVPIPIEYHPLYDSSKTGRGNTMNSTIHRTPVTRDAPFQAVRNLTGTEVSTFLEKVLRPFQRLDLITDEILPDGMLSYINIRETRPSATPQIKILVDTWMSKELVAHALDKVEGNSVIEFVHDRRMYNTAQEP